MRRIRLKSSERKTLASLK